MKKLFTCLILIICIFIPCISFAKTLKGGIEKIWTIESAKEEVFKDAKSWIDLSKYPSIDPNFNENKDLINKNQLDEKNRHIIVFSDGSYSVRFYNTVTEVYTYDETGRLTDVEFNLYDQNIYTSDDLKKYSDELLYPLKTYKHAYPSGRIICIILSIKENEAYAFLPNGELVQHCIDDKCYDAHGNLIYTRESQINSCSY